MRNIEQRETNEVLCCCCPYQILVNTLVELPLGGAALPELVVVVVEALPVGAELLQAGLVDVVDDAPGAAGDAAALLQALKLALARVLRLALHVVIVVVAAAGADEEGGREEGGRRRAELLDLGDRVRKGGGVDEDLLVEAILIGKRKESLSISQPDIDSQDRNDERQMQCAIESFWWWVLWYETTHIGLRAAILAVRSSSSSFRALRSFRCGKHGRPALGRVGWS